MLLAGMSSVKHCEKHKRVQVRHVSCVWPIACNQISVQLDVVGEWSHYFRVPLSNQVHQPTLTNLAARNKNMYRYELIKIKVKLW